MYESVKEIFDYLPIRRNPQENDYINHLWEAFTALNEGDVVARPFAIMPLHLLFMMSVQYKILRIYREQKEKYNLALIVKNPSDNEKDVLTPESPLAIAFLRESEIIDLLKIVGLSANDARNIKKSIIRYRNEKIAHAKGYIEQDLEVKIGEYFAWLEIIQESYRSMNQKIANDWLVQISFNRLSGIMSSALLGVDGGDDMDTFLETHFLTSCFSQHDFGDAIGILLESDELDFDQWTQVVNKGLELTRNQTISALRVITKSHLNVDKRINASRILQENS